MKKEFYGNHKKKYLSLTKALETLDESLQIINNPKNQYLYESLRDSTIQRFEYSIDTFWKFLKIYIQEKEAIDLEASSPRIILRQAESIGIIDKKSYQSLIDGLADRNLTSHVYNEGTAESILKNIPHYYEIMKLVTENLKLNNFNL